MSNTTILLKQLPHGKDLPIPAKATEGSSGLDLSAAIYDSRIIHPGKHLLIPTGFCWSIPEGFEGQIRPRSGLALDYKVTVLNTPGTIDSDYTGEVAVILINHGHQSFIVKRGMRIAQMVLQEVPHINCVVVEDLPKKGRDVDGFGSTGT